jgi:3-oxoadipate enol-lactonase
VSPPLVLLHPLGVDHTFWRDVVRRLAAEHGRADVVAFDLPGHGRGPALPPGASLEDVAGLVLCQLEARGLLPAHLIGVSLGGLVAQVVAATRPDGVVCLVLADTVAVYPEQMRTMWLERAATARAGDLASLVPPMESMWFTDAYRADRSSRVSEVRETVLAPDPEGYARTCEALARADVTATAGQITAPTLVVCGTGDAPPFVAAADWLVDHLPAAESAWLEGAHAVALERPHEFADVVASFTGRAG